MPPTAISLDLSVPHAASPTPISHPQWSTSPRRGILGSVGSPKVSEPLHSSSRRRDGRIHGPGEVPQGHAQACTSIQHGPCNWTALHARLRASRRSIMVAQVCLLARTMRRCAWPCSQPLSHIFCSLPQSLPHGVTEASSRYN